MLCCPSCLPHLPELLRGQRVQVPGSVLPGGAAAPAQKAPALSSVQPQDQSASFLSQARGAGVDPLSFTAVSRKSGYLPFGA